MNNNIDVKEALKDKNKEIYLNKLTIDIDNNHEVLLITLTNIIRMLSTEITFKLLEIIGQEVDHLEISKLVVTFQNKFCEEIELGLNSRLSKLKEAIIDIDNFDYQEILNKEKETFINKVQEIYQNNISLLKNVGLKSSPFIIERVNEYLDVLLFDKLLKKFMDTFNSMDMILYNNYLEGNEKFKDLNAKTLNLV